LAHISLKKEEYVHSGHRESGGVEESEEVNSKELGREESGDEFARSEADDRVRNGIRLIMSYDAESNSLIGTVENTEKKTLEQVRVEVHLSNGIELGPTTLVDLRPGEKKDSQISSN